MLFPPSALERALDSLDAGGDVTLHTMVDLAASTALRISEVVRLDRADVDLDTGVLLIRQPRFKKDRCAPTHQV